MAKLPERRYEVSIQRDGRTISGHYTLQDGMIKVTGPTGHSKTTQESGTSNDVLAKVILAEIVQQHGEDDE